MNVGVIVGTYSSVFIASPIFLYMDKKLYGGSVTGGRRGKAASIKATPAADPAK